MPDGTDDTMVADNPAEDTALLSDLPVDTSAGVTPEATAPVPTDAPQTNPAPTPAPTVLAPPLWDQVKALPDFQTMTDAQKGTAFSHWVNDSTKYLQASNVPRPQLSTFENYVQKESPNYGIGFIFNPDGTPQTNAQQAAIFGQPPNPDYPADFPHVIQQQPSTVGNAVEQAGTGFRQGITSIFTRDLPDEAAKVWDYVTGTAPSTNPVDETVGKEKQLIAENEAAQTGLSSKALSVGTAVGNFASTLTGAAGNVPKLVTAAKFALSGALEAVDSTYDNALNQGATPGEAAESAGVAGAVSTASMFALGPLSETAAGAVLGDNAEAFLNGAYRPTVAEAAKLIGLDAAGLFGVGATGQVAQNAADKGIYDKDRPLTQGAVDAGAQMALFSLIHAPTMVKAFWDNRSDIAAANRDQSNALVALDTANASGDPAKIKEAEDNYASAHGAFEDVVTDTAKNAPDPTPQDAIEAQQIVAKNPAASNPLDAAIAEATQEAQKPSLPVVGEPTDEQSQTTEPATPDAIPEDNTSESQDLESQPAEQGSESQAQSASPVAESGEQGVLRQRINTALGDSAPKSPIVFSADHDSPAWVDPDKPGVINVNPDVLGSVVKAYGESPKGGAQVDEYIRRLFAQKTGEEVIHQAQQSLREDTNHAAIHDEVTPEERAQTIAQYGNDSIDASKATSPEDKLDRQIGFVEEHARQILQRKALGETTEDALKNKPELVRYFQALYERIKAHVAAFGATPELKQYLKNIEGVLKDGGVDSEPSKFKGSQVAFSAKPEGSTMEQSDAEKLKGHYGAWIDRSGNVIPVKDLAGHAASALDHLAENPEKLSPEEETKILSGNPKAAAQSILNNRGYARVVNGDDEIKTSSTEPLTTKQLQKLAQMRDETGKTVTHELGMGPSRPITEASKPDLKDEGKELSKSPAFASFPNVRKFLSESLTDLKEYTPRLKATMQYMRKLAQKTQNSNALRDYIRAEVPDATQRAGIARWIDAGGDKEQLAQQEVATKDKELKAEYQAALNLSPHETQVANRLSTLLEAKRQEAVRWGMHIAKGENYFPRLVEKDPDKSRFAQTGKGINTGFSHAKQRTFKTMFEGEQAGVRYKTRDAADLMAAYQNSLDHAIASRQYIADLFKGKEQDGNPMLATPQNTMSNVVNPEGVAVHLIRPKRPPENLDNYVSLGNEIPALNGWALAGDINGEKVFNKVNLLVHPETANFLKKVFGKSSSNAIYSRSWWDSPATSESQAWGKYIAKKVFSDIPSAAKSNLFLLSPIFHPVQIGTEAAGHGVNPFKFGKIDYNDPGVSDAMDHALKLGDPDNQLNEEGRVDNNKTVIRGAEILARKLNLPNVADSAKWVGEANQSIQDFIFKTYIPSIKYNTYKVALARNMERMSKDIANGKVTEDQVKYLTGDQMNNAFGELNYTALERDPDNQTLARLLLLAPDFFEARARHLGQAITGSVRQSGREQFRAMALVSAAFIAAAQIGNKLINGETDMSHPFDIRIGNRYYGMRSSGGDAFRFFKDLYSLPTASQSGVPYIMNRLSPMMRFVIEAGMGVNWRGQKLGIGTAITDFLANNTPMVAQPLLSKVPYVGDFFSSSKGSRVSPFEQVLSALGIQVSRYSPIGQMKTKGMQWAASNPDLVGKKEDQSTHPPSRWLPLKDALEDGNYPEARAQYDSLLKDSKGNAMKMAGEARASIFYPFTGTPKGDQAFFRTLDAHDQALYRGAKAREALLIQRYNLVRNMKPTQ